MHKRMDGIEVTVMSKTVWSFASVIGSDMLSSKTELLSEEEMQENEVELTGSKVKKIAPSFS